MIKKQSKKNSHLDGWQTQSDGVDLPKTLPLFFSRRRGIGVGLNEMPHSFSKNGDFDKNSKSIYFQNFEYIKLYYFCCEKITLLVFCPISGLTK